MGNEEEGKRGEEELDQDLRKIEEENRKAIEKAKRRWRRQVYDNPFTLSIAVVLILSYALAKGFDLFQSVTLSTGFQRLISSLEALLLGIGFLLFAIYDKVCVLVVQFEKMSDKPKGV